MFRGLTQAGARLAASSRLGARSFRSTAALLDLRIGDAAPNFTQHSQKGSITFHEYLDDSWGILFSHPADFTPVCTTELGQVQRLLPEFEKRNVKVVALSVDSVEDHNKWIQDIVETQGISEISYPILADADRSVAKTYQMLDQTNITKAGLPLTVRSVFVVGPDKLIKLMITYPASTGRNFSEILRVLDSLQLTQYHKVATPVDWKQGDDCVVVPSLSDADATKQFPKGFKTIKPYLRMTPDPSV